MKTTIKTILIFTIVLTSCDSIRRTVIESYRYEMYIDFKNISYQGQNSMQKIYLEVDSTKGMWFYGKLIINYKDTVPIEGFEKGNHYVTTYKPFGSERYGGLEIWGQGKMGQIRDSLTIENHYSTGIIKEKTTLYRKPRLICH
ncbi:hypothetical protein FAM09_15260 [Niastella caeni]|uniref:Lipoprotein n=1 Tax=Niastella caeni TaxID=2569763 RepID=A0A4S8HXS6_9BACT|nr:hypothetical protein [Niastella caeni]THU38042.1 hypothetical protein FAM09_15260 [Niastella caeni]